MKLFGKWKRLVIPFVTMLSPISLFPQNRTLYAMKTTLVWWKNSKGSNKSNQVQMMEQNPRKDKKKGKA